MQSSEAVEHLLNGSAESEQCSSTAVSSAAASPQSREMSHRAVQTISEEDMKIQQANQNKRALQAASIEQQFQTLVMGKMMKELEEKVSEQTKMLEEISQKNEEERKQREKEKLCEHIPGPLKNEGKSLEEVVELVHNIITYKNYEDSMSEKDLKPARFKFLDERAYASLASHSLAAWLSTLEVFHLTHLQERVVSDVSMWISRVWRFKESAVYFHERDWDGLLSMCRLALLQKYPKYTTEGFQALYSKPPVIYLSSVAKPEIVQYLRIHLGLPSSAICLVPCSTTGKYERIDTEAFDVLVQSDLSVGKTPLLLLAYAGTYLTGATDKLEAISQICKRHRIWLHVEGYRLAQLATLAVPAVLREASEQLDSITLDLGAWLGLPSVPAATIYQSSVEESTAVEAGVLQSLSRHKLSVFPLWFSLLSMGHDGILARVKNANELMSHFEELLKPIPNMKIVKLEDKKKEETTREMTGFRDVVSSVLSFLLSVDPIPSVLLFKYTINREQPLKVQETAPYASPLTTNGVVGSAAPQPRRPNFVPETSPESAESQNEEEEAVDDEDERLPEYFDSLNKWLLHTLRLAVPEVGLTSVELSGEGVCLRFCALDTANFHDTTKADVDTFMGVLKENAAVMDATLQRRATFHAVVEAQDCLRLVHLDDWAGLGAVQYIPQPPPMVSGNGESMEPSFEEISELNKDLVSRLKSEDHAFSLSESSPVGPCVRFGLVKPPADVEELVAMVVAAGVAAEEQSRFYERMSDLVRRGIEETTRCLEKEAQEKLVKEGALRQVPFLDAVVNWWSPPPKDCRKGRTFNLASGEIQDTETTYKYRIQVQQSSALPGSNSGLLPPVDGSRKSLLKPVRKSTSRGGSAGGSGSGHDRQGSTSSRVTLDSEEETPSKQT